jgi:hypothetical protein
LGVNENWVPQRGQYPSASPGLPSLPRPTGCSQAPQNLRFSGTWGLASTAPAGSRAGIGGISISPAPRLPLDALEPPDRVLPDLVRRLPPLPVDAADPDVGADPDGGEPRPGAGGATGAAAIPQTSQ